MDNFIGSNIKNARIKAGFTQEKLAEKIDVSLSVISRLETGRTMVSVAKLIRIAQVLNVPAADFFDQTPRDYPVSEDSVSLTDANALHVLDPSAAAPNSEDLPSIDDELYFLIQQLPDKAKQYFKQSLRCYLEIF